MNTLFTNLRFRSSRFRSFLPFALLALLIVSAALPLSGCGQEASENANSYLLYFLDGNIQNPEFRAGSGALQAQPSSLSRRESSALEETASALLEELLQGPDSEDLSPVIPRGTSLLSLSVEGDEAIVNFSSPYGSLSGVSLTLADYAVTLTLTQIPEISVVRILVQGQQLSYRNQQSFMARDVLLDPEDDVVSTVDALLYFPDGDGVLTKEERTLSLHEGDTQVEAVARAIESGPENRKLLPIFPDGFRLSSVWQEGDICFVNLSSSLLHLLTENPDLPLPAALLALDSSLCSLDGVRDVRYLVDNVYSDIYGSATLTGPYGNTAVIRPRTRNSISAVP